MVPLLDQNTSGGEKQTKTRGALSWITDLMAYPYTMRISYSRYSVGSVGGMGVSCPRSGKKCGWKWRLRACVFVPRRAARAPRQCRCL